MVPKRKVTSNCTELGYGLFSGGNFQKIRAGDCVVAFSQWDLYQVRRKIESQTNKKCAIIYGGLPPGK